MSVLVTCPALKRHATNGLTMLLPFSEARVSSDSASVTADRMREEMGLPPRTLSQPAGTWTCVNMLRAPADPASQLAVQSGRYVAVA